MADAPPKYLEIAVPTPLRQSFHYAKPAHLPPLAPGIRVRVPFGRQTVTGVLLSESDSAPIDAARIKAPREILDSAPVITPPLMRLCRWAADYYHHPVGEVMATALPVLLRQGESLAGEEPLLELTESGRAIDLAEMKRAPAQSALIRLLQTESDGFRREELAARGFTRAVISATVDKALTRWTSKPRPQGEPFDRTDVNAPHTPITLTDGQHAAVRSILKVGTQPTLLFGITGSGKTEVYFEIIERVLRQGKQALVLVPEIGLTPQTVKRFKARFNVPIALFHSGMNDRERLGAFREAKSGSAGIVIGTRSAIFSPLLNPGLIVVDEEHDASFKQQDGFRYSARDLAVMRGQLEDVPVILGSATPSLESWHNARSGKYNLATLTARPGQAKPASYRVIDLRQAQLDHGFSPSLLAAIKTELEAGNQVLVFLNRRGYSPVLLCRDCGYLAACHRCDARPTVHRNSGLLICHHCTSQTRIPSTCPECGHAELITLGIGTQRIESDLAMLFSEFPVIRIDRDSTRNKNAMDRFMDEIEKGKPAILVGTQLLAKGHHFPDVTLVAIVDMDANFYSANYKAPERMGQLILQVGGRAGRAEKPGVVVIQTYLPDQPIFRQLIDEGYEDFADKLLEERERHELPPFYYHALIRAEATSQKLPTAFLDSIVEKVAPGASVNVLGPVPATMEKRAGKFRAHVLVSASARRPLKQTLDNCIAAAEHSEFVRKVRWSVDVDPIDLF